MSRTLVTPQTATSDRPVDLALHPIETGSYRSATPAIQAFAVEESKSVTAH